MKLVTVMRDSMPYLDRFMDQALRLRNLLGDVEVIIAEGDSQDPTYEMLREYRAFTGIRVLKVEHGGPYYPSLDIPFRWRQLAAVCNVALTAGVRDLAQDEPLVYVESDLIWEPDTIARLVKHLNMYPAVSPMSYYEGTQQNYETWGLVKNGQPAAKFAPHWEGWSDSMMHQIDSQGSCVALSYTAAQVAYFSPVDCIKGIGASLRQNGLSLWLDPTLKVEHPRHDHRQ